MRFLLPLALVASLLLGCSDEEGGRLVIAGDGELNPGVRLSIKARPGEQWIVGDMPVCPTEAGVEVTGVTTIGNVEVTGFDLRENPFVNGEMMAGSARGTLEENGLESPTVEALSEPCGDEDQFYELIVEIRAGETDTGASGYRVSYSSGGKHGTLDVKYGIYACVDLSSETCADRRQP